MSAATVGEEMEVVMVRIEVGNPIEAVASAVMMHIPIHTHQSRCQLNSLKLQPQHQF